MISSSLRIDYINSGLTSIPAPTAEETECTHLVITDNFIYNIHTNDFVSYPKVKNLNLRNNSIDTIAENAFNGLTQLVDLSLETNNILQLPNNLGFPVQNLERWVLWNAMKDDVTYSFEYPYFSAFINLNNLDLGSIKHQVTFNTTILPRTLTYLRLTLTQISQFPDFSNMGSLKTLMINSNSLAYIPLDNLKTLSGLRKLDIQRNMLTSLPDISFMADLETLLINNNQLNTLPDLYDTSLTILEMAGNPLECNQSLCWIRMWWPWMKDPMLLRDNPKCVSPSTVQGKELMDLRPTYLQCYKGKVNYPETKVHGANMGLIWGGAERTEVGPMLALWTLLYGTVDFHSKY